MIYPLDKRNTKKQKTNQLIFLGQLIFNDESKSEKTVNYGFECGLKTLRCAKTSSQMLQTSKVKFCK